MFVRCVVNTILMCVIRYMSLKRESVTLKIANKGKIINGMAKRGKRKCWRCLWNTSYKYWGKIENFILKQPKRQILISIYLFYTTNIYTYVY